MPEFKVQGVEETAMPTQNELESCPNLIVILPESMAGNISLAYRIYWLAEQESRNVLYFTLAEDQQHLLQISRRLATMKALTSNPKTRTSSKIVPRNDAMRILPQIFHAGDRIVCPPELTVKTGLLHQAPITTYLQEELHLPVTPIAGFYKPLKVQTQHWLNVLVFWAICLLLMGFFTYLEVEIDQQLHGALRSILFYLSISLEFGAILTWNHIYPI